MKKLESSIRNMVLSLTLISIVVAGLLALVYGLTKDPIALAEQQKQEKAIKEVTPGFNNNPVAEQSEVVLSTGEKLTVFPAKKDGKLVGVAVETNTQQGFSGEIRIMAGFDMNGKVINYTVLKHAETPGLGANMQAWFSDTTKPAQNVIDRQWHNDMKVTKDGGEVDAITAATITSRAFIDAINKAYEAFTVMKGGQNE
ncbi:MAG: RnfABCDGE type electron transport complex subunit G [Candidatus Symbiothrix sp.]|jgi:electron transport complex protein RnfG|nr:RnfABCDGE type electron transport complex subunit G [Candidatus Symbiothrix sp.]